MLPIHLNILPKGFPNRVPPPKFQMGARVRWRPQPTEDFGTITGIQYAPAQHLQTWAWKYTVWFDLQSPSRLWLMSDTAWEFDLEALPTVPHPQVTSEHEQP